MSWPTTGGGLIRPITAVIVQVTCPGNRDAAPAGTWVLIRRAGTGWKITQCEAPAKNIALANFVASVCVPEQVMLDSSSSFPQSLSPSHSQRRGMQRLFLHLNLSVGQVCWSGDEGRTNWRVRLRERGANEWKREQIFQLILWPYFSVFFLDGLLFCLGREHVCAATTDGQTSRRRAFPDPETLLHSSLHKHTLTYHALTYPVLAYTQN